MSNVQPIASYKLNASNAKSVGVSQSITEKGGYPGTFTRAEAVVSNQGTQGIEFSFRSNDGQTSDYLTLWTVNNDGKELYGRKVLDALMTCMKVREIQAERATIIKRNYRNGQDENVPAVVFPSLMNRPIGLLLVREEYVKDNGDVGWKMVIVGAFEPATKRLPKEVLDNAPAELFDKVVPLLKDRPLKQRPLGAQRQQSGGSHTGGQQRVPSGTDFDDMDDDIPF